MSTLPQPADEQPATGAVKVGLLGDKRFLRYGYAKFLQLLAQNALIYGLFIAVISRQESSLATSAFVLASVIPSILLSLPGGLFADLVPKKAAILSTMAGRLFIVYLFIDADPAIMTVIAFTFLLFTVYQFFSPAENAAVLAIVPRERLAAASSILQATSLVAQLAGAGIVAPLAIRFLDARGLYVIVFVLFAISTALFATLRNLSPPRKETAQRLSWFRALPVGYRTIAADSRLTSVTLMRVLLDTGMLTFIVIAPVFIEETLNAGAENAIYIAIPGALGLAFGLLIAPALLTFFSARGVVLTGFVFFTAVLLVLPFLDTLAPQLAQALGPFRELQRLTNLSDPIIASVMLLPLAGLGASLVQVGARTEVYRRAPSDVIAQVFATQSAFGSIGALMPTFLAGVLLDVLPVRVVLVFVGVSLAGLSTAAWLRGARQRPRTPPPAGTRQHDETDHWV